jgi:hypothetical protein
MKDQLHDAYKEAFSPFAEDNMKIVHALRDIREEPIGEFLTVGGTMLQPINDDGIDELRTKGLL